jgi:AcrR family transcriptional regulator
MSVALKVETDGKPRVAIMNVAMHLFGKQGFSGTSMRDIANAVGLLPGSLYAHIDSKEAVLIEIVADGIGRFISAVEPYVGTPGNPVDRLRSMILAHVEVVADNPERSQVVFHQWRFLSEKNLPDAVERRRRYEACFIETLEEGMQAGLIRSDINLRISVLTILGALNWTPEWFSPNGKLSAAEVGDRMADTLLGGILA